ncbi:hypothetical protein GCM10023238_39170 [Streptomyces heliomycini]
MCADAARLQQVLVNLLGNARNHTPPGTTVTARVRRDGPWLCLDVVDNGPGIPTALLPRIFERFARGDSARTRATGSTGLGLAIVQAVATAHGGAVTVDSVPGHTAFTLHLPAVEPRSAPEPYPQPRTASPHGTTGRLSRVGSMRTDSSPGTLPAREHLPAAGAGTPVLDVVIPVYNEEKDLKPCVRRLHEHLTRTFPYAFRITIADNASTDGTPHVAGRLAERFPRVRSVRLEQKGRGRALRTVWSASDAPVPRLHGRGPVHRPQRAAPAGRPADLRPLRPRHRLPAEPQLTRGAGRQTGVHQPLVQPDPARLAAGPLLRRAVRVQGDPP